MQIYFLLTEQQFETYADAAAAKYYAEESTRKEAYEAKRKA